jgi:signal transduction histidine kinase
MRANALTLRSRAAPLVIFGVALLILVSGIVASFQFNAVYTKARVQQTQSLADVLAASTSAAVDFDDPAAAQQTADAYRVDKQVRLIGVYNRNGRAVAGFQRSGAPVPATVEQLPPQSSKLIRVQAPITSAGQHIGTVYVDIDKDLHSRAVARYGILLGMFLLAALVVASLGLAQLQLRRANRALADRAEALAQANELLEEQMEQRAAAEEQLRQSQKMQALGQLTGGIAHDFNNLLTVIQGSADMLCRPDLPEQKRVRFAQAIVQAASNAAALTSQLLAFARRQPLKPEQIDVNTLIAEMNELIDRVTGERIQVLVEPAPVSCPIEADRTQLQAAILNVASNARDAMPGGGVLAIRTETSSRDDGTPMIAIAIEDSGTGMDAETIDRIFEPFFTTKAVGKGTGLGLSQVYGFATQSGGEVHVESEPGRGTKVTILLPCVKPAAALPAEAEVSAAELHSSVKILVVEDNEEVGAFAEILLSELGHRVTRASSGEQALDEVRSNVFDIVVSDVVMPGMGGLKLAEILSREQPGLPVVLATGYSQEIAETGSGGRPVILKPYRLATLSEALTAALNEKHS